ncbi:phage holin family protein [Nonomuraea wenchangensis]|uniref:Putative Holin-X, holin superfamily III n=1 Tax=Nonomuraea wenchangensis TaxID=568860 RepID=A0A1I0J1G3_9ACTN|nr:phage holin family protein [Nonomuraea wenchangensis]SEU02860.1 Putative Holin-X, holin superfamily III [Nonomuraea wenchangensis]
MSDTQKLVSDLSVQVTRLVKDELRLARMELTAKGKRAGLGAGLFGAAGTAAFYGGAALVAAVILLLALVMPAWVAALVVGVVLLVVAAVLGLVGKNQVQRATPPVPEETIASVKADIDMVKERAHR